MSVFQITANSKLLERKLNCKKKRENLYSFYIFCLERYRRQEKKMKVKMFSNSIACGM